MPAGTYGIEAFADRDVQRAATPRYTNEQLIDRARQPRPPLVAARSRAALDASRRAGDPVEVSRMRRERRVLHDATLAKGSDIPPRFAAASNRTFDR